MPTSTSSKIDLFIDDYKRKLDSLDQAKRDAERKLTEEQLSFKGMAFISPNDGSLFFKNVRYYREQAPDLVAWLKSWYDRPEKP